jgi:hypothetical protein
MDDKDEVNENESHKGEVNEKEIKSKRYMSADHTYYILIHNNYLVLWVHEILK